MAGDHTVAAPIKTVQLTTTVRGALSQQILKGIVYLARQILAVGLIELKVELGVLIGNLQGTGGSMHYDYPSLG